MDVNHSENTVSDTEDVGELKQRLVKRAALAGGLIVTLLAGLAVVDVFNATPPTVQVAVAPTVSAPVYKPPVLEDKPVLPPDPAGTTEAIKPEAALEPQAAVEPPPAPEVNATPSLSAKPVLPERLERPLTKPAVPHLAISKPNEPLPQLKRSEPTRELTRQATTAQSLSVPQASLLAKPLASAPASRPLSKLAAQHAALAGEGRHGLYLLQLGVFNSTDNAEELRAKLELNGIPSQIEARVQVGPFKTRLEAEQARDKLRALGIEPGLVMALKK